MTTIYTSFSEGLYITLFSIVIVFLILFLISLVIESLKHINKKENKKSVTPKIKNTFSIEDIKDENMMVAALIASIEHQDKTKGDVRVLSIKEL